MTKCRLGRAAILVVVGVVCLEIGAAGGVWFAQRYLQPPRRPAPSARSAVPASQPVPRMPRRAAREQPPVRVSVAENPVPSRVRARSHEGGTIERRSQRAETHRVAVREPATTSRAAPHASIVGAATSRPRRRTTLYTCPTAAHLDTTTDRPGTCPKCGRPLVPAHKVPHGLQAMDWYAKHGAAAPTPSTRSSGNRPTSRPTASRPARAAHPPPTLYTCPRADHIASTTTRPGRCPLCRADLVRAVTVDHGLKAMQYYADHEDRAAESSRTRRPALYTCPTVQHVDVTTTQPGKCPRCGLALLPVERVGHEARAVRAWRKKQSEATSPPPAKQTVPPRPLVLYTCPVLEHVDVTTPHPGTCPRCGLRLRRVDQVVHRAKAEAAYRKKLADQHARRMP